MSRPGDARGTRRESRSLRRASAALSGCVETKSPASSAQTPRRCPRDGSPHRHHFPVEDGKQFPRLRGDGSGRTGCRGTAPFPAPSGALRSSWRTAHSSTGCGSPIASSRRRNRSIRAAGRSLGSRGLSSWPEGPGVRRGDPVQLGELPAPVARRCRNSGSSLPDPGHRRRYGPGDRIRSRRERLGFCTSESDAHPAAAVAVARTNSGTLKRARPIRLPTGRRRKFERSGEGRALRLRPRGRSTAESPSPGPSR